MGKTELAKALAEFMFDDERAIVRLDMSEYMEKHTVSRLVGAPPGYVGYDEGGQLTEAVRRRPYCVILLDEIEKAHSDVFNVLLQLLDDGRLTDGQGRTVDFRNTVVIMTSNIRSQPQLLDHFRPEFVNRVDEIVVFEPLTSEQIGTIVELQLERLRARLAERRIELELSDEAVALIAEAGWDPSFGARPLKRAIQRSRRESARARAARGRFADGDTVRAVVDGDAIRFETAPVPAPGLSDDEAVSRQPVAACGQRARAAARAPRSRAGHRRAHGEGTRPGGRGRRRCSLLREGDARWLVAPYGERNWVKNARAAGSSSCAAGSSNQRRRSSTRRRVRRCSSTDGGLAGCRVRFFGVYAPNPEGAEPTRQRRSGVGSLRWSSGPRVAARRFRRRGGGALEATGSRPVGSVGFHRLPQTLTGVGAVSRCSDRWSTVPRCRRAASHSGRSLRPFIAATGELDGRDGLVCGIGPVEAAAAPHALRGRQLGRGSPCRRRRRPRARTGVARDRVDCGVYCDLAAAIAVVDRVDADPRLVAAAREALAGTRRCCRSATSAAVGHGSATALAVEAMEGFGVLRAAALAGVPAVEVRAISNEIGEPDRTRWQIAEAIEALSACRPGPAREDRGLGGVMLA